METTQDPPGPPQSMQDVAAEGFTTGDRSQLIDGGNQFDTPTSDTPKSEFSPLHMENDSNKKVTSEGLRIIIISSITFAISVTVALILTIYLAPPPVAQHAGVATEDAVCSAIGIDVLKKGGSAVDAAIASMLCVGVISPHHSGLGGGGYMIIRLHKQNKTAVIDFRETAPKAASEHMYDNNPASKKTGGLSVAVPGELKGLADAHEQYGKLDWKDLVLPASKVAKEGFNVTQSLAKAIREKIKPVDAQLYEIFYKDGEPLREGDTMTRPRYAALLEQIAEHGASVLYEGEVAQDIVDTINDNEGAFELDDLKTYSTIDTQPIHTQLGEYIVETTSAPTGGPLVLLILNIMESYGFNKTDPLYYHRLVEAIKFSYGVGQGLSDPNFSSTATEVARQMANKSFAEDIQGLITDGSTHLSPEYYTNAGNLAESGGTSHVSVIGPHEDLVSITSTINQAFGAKLVTSHGIFLNNEMDDFSVPGDPNSNKDNYPTSGKRPLSHVAPVVIHKVNKNCGERMAIGGTNGTRIPTGVAEVILDHFGFHNNLNFSLERPRIHDPLFPDRIEYEAGLGKDVLLKLNATGHQDFLLNEEGINIVNAVLKVNETVYAQSDSRNGGQAAFY